MVTKKEWWLQTHRRVHTLMMAHHLRYLLLFACLFCAATAQNRHGRRAPRARQRARRLELGSTCTESGPACGGGLECVCGERQGRRLFGAPAADAPVCTCVTAPSPPPPPRPPPPPPPVSPPPTQPPPPPIYTLGGNHYSSGRQSHVHAFDPGANSWTNVGSLALPTTPGGVASLVATRLGSHLYTGGGCTHAPRIGSPLACVSLCACCLRSPLRSLTGSRWVSCQLE